MESLTFTEYVKNLPNDRISPRTALIKKLAVECKVDESTVYRWIKGKAKPDDLAKAVISRVINIPIEQLGL